MANRETLEIRERLFEETEQAELYQRYRINYEGAGIEEQLLKSVFPNTQQAARASCAVDIGCGTGFLTRLLSPHFTKVIGVDCSVAQLDEAKRATPQKNVEYVPGAAEDLHFIPSNSVQLITVAKALHYFNADNFFLEVDRILVPSGCLCIIHSSEATCPWRILPHTTNKEVIQKSQDLMYELLNGLFQHFEESTKKVLLEGIPKPPRLHQEKVFAVTTSRVGNLEDLFGLLKSIGVFRKYFKMNPEEKSVLDVYKRRFLEVLREVSTTPEEVKITVSTPLECWLFRKPENRPESADKQ